MRNQELSSLHVCIYTLLGSDDEMSQRKVGGRTQGPKNITFLHPSQRYPGFTSLYMKLSIKLGVLGVELPLKMNVVQVKLPLKMAAWQMELSVTLSSSVCYVVNKTGWCILKAASSDLIELKVLINSLVYSSPTFFLFNEKILGILQSL